jgi:sterol 3beta-glucosyltransferase
MKITILTIGSRGDIQPYVALGVGLQAAGHRVCLATETIYQGFVIEQGLDFAPLPGNSHQRHAQTEWMTFLETDGGNIWRYMRHGVKQFVLPLLPDMMDMAWHACEGSDAVISMPQVPVSIHVAEALDLPFYLAWTTATTATQEFPHPMLRLNRSLGRFLNPLTYRLIDNLYLGLINPTICRLRQEILNLPAVMTRSLPVPFLYCYSPTLLPKPKDWPNWVHVTGYWFLDRPAHWQPPQDLVEFLAAGAPPVYLGFGSMTERDPTAMTRLLLEAIARTQQRAILCSGWAGLGQMDLPDGVYRLESDIPFGWLFPQMAAVVHHGGSGTVAEGLRAGVPQAVVYQPFSDQFFLGKRLAALGVGAAPIARHQLTVDRLTQAIQTAVNPILQARAATVAQQVRQENGVAAAIDAFHQYQPTSTDRTLILQGGTG